MGEGIKLTNLNKAKRPQKRSFFRCTISSLQLQKVNIKS